MASVFLSYDHDDAKRAAPIAAALEKAGHSVWWDRFIKGGAEYNDEIEAAVQASDAVIVLWSDRSIHSTWVRDEAAEGRDQGKLIPVRIDNVKPPMGFRQFQTIDLIRSGRFPNANAIGQVLESIRAIGAVPQHHSQTSGAKPANAFGWIGRRTSIAAMALGVVGCIVFVGWSWIGSPTLPVVVVAPSDSAPRSQALSRDLIVKLGTLAHVGASKWRLADGPSAPSNPDFLFRAAAAGSSAQLQASLVLIDGKHDSLLWSREFNQPGNSEADVHQQVSLSAGVALVCALETREAGGLPPDLFKRYLASCTEAAVGSDAETDKPVALMRSIIAERPGFTPAWSQLLSTQADLVSIAKIRGGTELTTARQQLIKDIETARKVAPDLPEIALAETELLSPFDYAGLLKQVGLAKRQAPDKADSWAIEAFALARVGRMFEAVVSARRAAALEPLAPTYANQLLFSLAYAGQTEAARRELLLVERKWAGTGVLRDAQWAFHLRFGDPRIAMAVRGQADNLYLKARLEPTPANIHAMMDDIEKADASDPELVNYAIQALAEFDETDEVYGWLNRVPPERLAMHSYVLFRPAFDDVIRDGRFMSVAKRIGLLSYWRKSGNWPDFCYDPKLPYDCRKEAARLAA